jgi:hypothetical protein
MGLPFLLEEICGPILGVYKSHRHMNAEIGTEAAQFPEKEYINEIVVAVCRTIGLHSVGLLDLGKLSDYQLSD